ncbi:MAG: response regulator, partial [Alphaproteobacteria bacterium]|nr:response regulator [Alphaproteobacteria bacterium]
MTTEKDQNTIDTIEALKQAVAQADELAQQKSNFLATMSHEIRTPMQTIYGLLELIATEKPDENIANMVQTAQNAASSLLEILDDILDVAKMDAGAMELDIFEVPVRLLVYGILEALSVRVRGIHVKLIDDIDTDVPFVILGDPKRLRQIIMNLCSNALKFTHEGSVTVRVNTKAQHVPSPDNGFVLRFEVIDTGIGIKSSVCEELFSPFTQADNTTSRKYGGTGLGLSISRKLVELMNGKIGVISEENKGATFWFEIPTEEISTDEERVELPDLEGISILSVEDHPQGAKEIRTSLRSMGARVEQCGTCAEALGLALQHPFDVAVIDQGLPDGLGIDIIKEMMVLRPYTGMIMYTVRNDIGLAHSLHSLGALYLTKPAGRRGLGEAVKSATRQHKTIIAEDAKLLIAEDTEGVRDILRRQLEHLNCEAHFVSDGQKALDALESGEYNILITDLHMPHIDGYELTNHIREGKTSVKKDLPIIALTADVQLTQRENYAHYGFDEYLLKPVTIGQLRGLLVRWRLLDKQIASIEPPEKPQPAVKKVETPSIDQACLIEQIGSLDERTGDMMYMFIDMTTPLIEKINQALENGD